MRTLCYTYLFTCDIFCIIWEAKALCRLPVDILVNHILLQRLVFNVCRDDLHIYTPQLLHVIITPPAFLLLFEVDTSCWKCALPQLEFIHDSLTKRAFWGEAPLILPQPQVHINR